MAVSSVHLPAGINIAAAKLPQTYELAKVALANCNKVDECKSWSDKAAAIAAYARMADDSTLHDFATRHQRPGRQASWPTARAV